MADEGRTEPEIKCTFCDKKQQFMKLCSRCRTDVYCSKECQVKDWPDHKRKCTVTGIKLKSKEDNIKNPVLTEECFTDSKEIGHSSIKMHSISKATKTELKTVSSNQKCSDSHAKQLKDDVLLEKCTTYGLEDGESKSNSTILIFIKHNKVKSQLQLKVSQDSELLLQQISDFVRIPVSKLKLVCKGKIVTPENISSFVHNKAVFLALGEVSESEEGLDKGDIETLMQQLNVERNIAVRALKKTGSLLEAIFDVGNNL